ncbi:Transcriptional regulator, TetR family protein [Minicystis rosea]|nr:Transcriptional regulator, TetR family protein [Minicystis rosea]
MSTKNLEGTARERLLAAAAELFYAEGIHTVGIDRVIERAGVAKASLYSAFGSKDELVRAYLEQRDAARRARITERLARHAKPRDRILAIFDVQRELAEKPGFRGCAFVNASVETASGESKAGAVCMASRAWMRGLFIDLARELGAAKPELLGRKLAMLYDGATVAASIEHDLQALVEARAMAEQLLDTATKPARAPSKRKGG